MEKEVRLIDADKLKNHYAWWENGTAEMTLAEAKKNFDVIIDVQPTVDAVEVVRCKDCVNATRDKYGIVCTCHDRDVGEDDYCSWGERREDAKEE